MNVIVFMDILEHQIQEKKKKKKKKKKKYIYIYIYIYNKVILSIFLILIK